MNRKHAGGINSLWAELIVGELCRGGVELFCLSPGSRSSPLAAAVAARKGIQAVVHPDERGTAFFAVGHARATGRPAAWITTSGTAAANGLPAVVEAAQSNIPLILLTADRPPELRDTGANQTIDQVGLFGPYVRWHFDLPPASTEIDPRMVVSTAAQAAYRAVRPPRGPVHLNCMYREPLVGAEAPVNREAYLDGLVEEGGTGVEPPELRPTTAVMARVEDSVSAACRGLLVVGQLDTPAEADAVIRLGHALGWPLLPDITSGLRTGIEAPHRIANFDLVLLSESYASAHRPDVVLHMGGRVTSKRLSEFIHSSPLSAYAMVKPHPSRQDPHHRVTLNVESDIVGFCDELGARIEPALETGWLPAWVEASRRVEVALETLLGGEDALNEPVVARLISREAPVGTGLVVSSSMPIRDLDMFAVSDGPLLQVTANRGASGIDGVLATAAGYGTGLRSPVTVFIGDLALLHDLNSLALLRSVGRPVVVVVLNNNGGGIFHFLPIADRPDVFEAYFGTPHGLTFEHAARLFGLGYANPATRSAFSAAYADALGSSGGSIIEVRTDRNENAAFHRALWKGIQTAVET